MKTGVSVDISVPWQPTLARSVGPDTRIFLPLSIRASLDPVGLLQLMIAVVVILVIATACLFVSLTRPLLDWNALATLTVGLGLVGLGVSFSAAPATVFNDFLRRQPIIIIARETILDLRCAPQPIPWSAVARATIVYQHRVGIAGIRLKLRTAVAADHNPFRPGALGLCWRRRADEVYLPCLFLSVTPHVLAHVVATLVTRHGGIVET